MIRLAANYSQVLLALMDEHPGIVDAVKVSEFDRPEYAVDYRTLVARGIPLVLHGLGRSLAPGTPSFRAGLDPAAVRQAVSIARPAYLSVHLEWRSNEPFPGREPFLAKLRSDVDLLREIAGLPVHLENIFSYRVPDPRPDRANFNPAIFGDPEFISEAVASTGTRFLLDIGHAQVAAWNRGEGAGAYLARLPLTAVDEMHITGPAMVDGTLRDRHGEIDDEGYGLLASALGRSGARTVSLEYGGVGPAFEGRSDAAILRRQLLRLREVITAAGGRAAGAQ